MHDLTRPPDPDIDDSAAPGDEDAAGLPLESGYQAMLLREICEDTGFAAEVIPQLKPAYFSANEAYAWAFDAIQTFERSYHGPPGWAELEHLALRLPADRRDTIRDVLQSIAQRPVLRPAQKQWLADEVFEFVTDKLFVQASIYAKQLHDRGDKKGARELMVAKMAHLATLRQQGVERRFHCAEYAERRTRNRAAKTDPTRVVPTGFARLDELLSGDGNWRKGMEVGRLGLWMAYSKGGKSVMLANLGVAALRNDAKVLHIVLEGSMEEAQARYDAHFAQVDSRLTARGEYPQDLWDKMVAEYERYKNALVIRRFSAKERSGRVQAADIGRELRLLEQSHGFVPQVIIVDYADWMTGCDDRYKSVTERHVAVYEELKELAGEGYVVWTAAQPQRPDPDHKIKPGRITSEMISDAYGKIRLVDFCGSINSTYLEREHNVARLYLELARGAPMDEEYVVHADFARVTIAERRGIQSPHQVGHAARKLGDLSDSIAAPERPKLPRRQRAL